MSPFVLYGLIGCPHCEAAEKFLRVRNVPTSLIIANDDPIAYAGSVALAQQKAKAAGKSEQEVSETKDEYPILVSRVTKETIIGFKEEEYARVIAVYFNLASAGAPSVFAGQQQSQS